MENNIKVMLNTIKLISKDEYKFPLKTEEENMFIMCSNIRELLIGYGLPIPQVITFSNSRYNTFICLKCNKIIIKYPKNSIIVIVTEVVDEKPGYYICPKCENTNIQIGNGWNEYCPDCDIRILVIAHDCI